MPFIAGCWRRPAAALAAATILLSGCAGVGFDGGVGVCPPAVEYSREFQARLDDELELLTERAAADEMLSDYAVMRDQARDSK